MAKRQKNNDLQNITHKTKDTVTRTLLKQGMNSGRVSSSCSTCGTRRVNPVISHEWGKDREVLTTSR